MKLELADCQHCGHRIRLTFRYTSGWVHLKTGKPQCFPPTDARMATPKEIAA